MNRVYLVGPIAGQSYEGAASWREEVSEELTRMGFRCFNPMAGKKMLQGTEKIPHSCDRGEMTQQHAVLQDDSIYNKDIYCVENSQIIVANFLNIKPGFSVGSFFELGYAKALRKTLIVVATHPKIIEHPFIKQSSIVVDTLEKMYQIMEAIRPSGYECSMPVAGCSSNNYPV